MRSLDDLRRDVLNADDTVAALRAASESQEAAIREARGSLDAIRAAVAEFDIARHRRKRALIWRPPVSKRSGHLDEVVAESRARKRGQATPDARVICVDDGVDAGDVDEEAPADAWTPPSWSRPERKR